VLQQPLSCIRYMKVLLYAVFKDLTADRFVTSGLVNVSRSLRPLGSARSTMISALRPKHRLARANGR
jgi:hypothetical protein